MHSMKVAIAFFVFSSICMVSDSTLILKGILIIKALAGAAIIGGIAGGIVGGAGRGGQSYELGRFSRSVSNLDDQLLIASQNDPDDCAKKLIW